MLISCPIRLLVLRKSEELYRHILICTILRYVQSSYVRLTGTLARRSSFDRFSASLIILFNLLIYSVTFYSFLVYLLFNIHF